MRGMTLTTTIDQNNTMNPLIYVFSVEVLSCKDDGSWVERPRVLQLNTVKNSVYVIAGNIAAHHMKPTERGVRVRFLGLQEDKTNGGKKPQPSDEPITLMNPFTIELKRDLQ